ncbi:subtilase-type protease inhibitor [Streptomyces sp. NPDC051567]|uniref:subtilase-type protease inhibitor n=1 Tax=Streptomyces sp. NPDC051567 TaxID=3365660 RepID=UPI003794DFA3
MRFIARGLGLGSAAMALTALTALAWPGTAGAAPTGTAGLHAPSALVLTVTAGDDAARGTVLRAVTLTCAPRPGGTHPAPSAACAELRTHATTLDVLTAPATDAACTREWNPVTVTADGAWQGRRLSYAHTFGNACGFAVTTGTLFDF